MEKITSRENAKVKYACRLASSGAFRRAEEYRAAHGDLQVPVNYKTGDGFCLGDWVRRMRESYAAADDRLTAAHIQKLEALGMVWTMPQES